MCGEGHLVRISCELFSYGTPLGGGSQNWCAVVLCLAGQI